MREWRGRAGGVSVKSGQEHVCKDAGVQAAEVQRALGSACPHSRAAAARSFAAGKKKIAAQLPTTGRDRRGRWIPEASARERIFSVHGSSCVRGPKSSMERRPDRRHEVQSGDDERFSVSSHLSKMGPGFLD